MNSTPVGKTEEDVREEPKRFGAVIVLVIGGIGIGFAPVFSKIAINSGGFGPSAAGFWRMLLALPILLSFSFVMILAGRGSKHVNAEDSTPSPPRPLRHWLWLSVPGLVFGGDLAVWHLSFLYTSAAAATLLANCQVVLVGLVSWLFLHERLKWQYPFGAGLALIGIVMLLVWGGEPIAVGRNPLTGNLLGLLTACFYASYILSVQHVRRMFSTMQVMIAVSAISGGVLLIVAMLSGEQIWQSNAAGWWAVIGLAVVPHCLGQGLVVYALAKLPVSFTSVTLLIQPVGAGVWAWLMLGENLTGFQILAGMVVLVGIYFARRGSG